MLQERTHSVEDQVAGRIDAGLHVEVPFCRKVIDW